MFCCELIAEFEQALAQVGSHKQAIVTTEPCVFTRIYHFWNASLNSEIFPFIIF